MKLTIKKEYKDLIPPLTENEFKQLEENCMHNGIRDAICVIPDLDPPSNYCKYCYEETEMIFEDDLWMCKKCHHFPYQQEFIIVDGHNRFKIAQDNKLDFDVYCLEDIEYDDQYAIKDWIINNQLGRRNLTDNQKKQLRGLKYNNEKAKHGTNQHTRSSKFYHSLKTHDRLAEELGVSSRTIQNDGEWVKGLEHIDEELKQDILQQKIKVRASDIQEIAKAEPMFIAHSKDDIIKKAREIQKEKKAAKEYERENRRKELAKLGEQVKLDDIKIHWMEFQQGCKEINPNSVDAIITDPPYPIEYIHLWEDLFKVADRILKPSSFLICYANHQNLDKIFQLPNPLKYYWTFKLDFTAKPIAMGRNLIATWKPVLIYQKLPFKKIEVTIEDAVKEEKKFVYEDRTMHDKNWQQSIGKFEYLIEKFTNPGDLIVEPFAGTGTTLVACKNTKRRCIGYEIEKKYIGLIKGRLHEGN